MIDERLVDFPSKSVPVGADIVYIGDSASSYAEVQSTIAEIFAGYSPALVSLAALSSSTDTMPYYSASNTFALTSLTAFARTLLANTSAANAAVTLAVLPLLGGTMLGNINMGGNLMNNLGTPLVSTDGANKGYVDAFAQGITVQGACHLGTTTALTATYNNGVAGVGATLTNSGAQAALNLDGVAASVNDRILVKNQASALQNGIYTVTNIGSISTNWILTRSTDYNQPAQINVGDLVIITAGSTLASSSWLQTATVNTIGTDAINFSQFTASLPVGVTAGGTGLTSTTINQLLYSSSNNVLAGLATANNAMLTTNSSGVPSFGQTFITNTAFTPVLTFGGASTGITYSVQYGNYTQIGNIVFYAFQITLSSKGSSTGVAAFTGLPVTVGDSTAGSASFAPILQYSNITVVGNLTAAPHAGSTRVDIIDTNGTHQLDNTNFADNTNIIGVGFYFTT